MVEKMRKSLILFMSFPCYLFLWESMFLLQTLNPKKTSL